MTIHIEESKGNRGTTKFASGVIVMVMFLVSAQFLITPFFQSMVAISQYLNKVDGRYPSNGNSKNVLNHTPTPISIEHFLETEMIDSSRCGGNTSIDTYKLPERWCLNNESNMPFYVGHEPKDLTTRSFVRHYNHNGYERCLANKTVVFIGDSRVRYQFMYLVSYLSTKRHMKCKDSFPSIKKEDVECEMIMREFNRRRQGVINWNSWYN